MSELAEQLRGFAKHMTPSGLGGPGCALSPDRRHKLIEAADEIERLCHDIERHVGITTSQQAEIERLRAALQKIKESSPAANHIEMAASALIAAE